ncbi:DUF4879 domain-containing protein [Corallococcus interemptor]|uniref:DUF4879 domain-containing protein n=2 Tax=Corallococcus interemptor TaxID=2316720 RepID=A0A3A8PVR2_9BACT|nr:DUF4879 domain-containing protein [Corallococcus interemptor]
MTMHAKMLAVALSTVAMTASAADFTPAEPARRYVESTLRGETLDVSSQRLGRVPEAGRVTTLGPAPALSYVQVYAVGSSNVGWEYVSSSAFSTTYDHGGAVLLVAVLEFGYGTSRYVTMAGSVLSGSANYANDSICDDGFGNAVTPCSPGQTIIGFLRYYDVSGNQSGSFYYQSTSINSPFNTMSDSMSIL